MNSDVDDVHPLRGVAPLCGDDRPEIDDEPDFDEPSFSTWNVASHGPDPLPQWVITDSNAIDTDLGVLKTGKEADVHVVNRALPGGPDCLLAAKRYRSSEHRMFHRDAGYLEGRREKKSREKRAMTRRTDFGRELIASRWAGAEFAALSSLWSLGVPVPYPVQLHDSELMLEFIGDRSGQAAPRLATLRPSVSELADLFDQLTEAMRTMARAGYAHGDLSPYNLLVDDGRLVLIDLPQVVELAVNPQGADYLQRDCENVCGWFVRRGLDNVEADYLFGDLMAEAVGMG
jgi:RIO kinase 1